MDSKNMNHDIEEQIIRDMMLEEYKPEFIEEGIRDAIRRTLKKVKNAKKNKN